MACLAISLVGSWMVTASYAAPQSAPLFANAAAGQTLYQQYCASCHGANAEGGAKLGDSTATALRWEHLGPVYKNDPALVSRAIVQGLDQDGQALDDVMPRWQNKLTTAQVQNIVTYLQTLTTEAPGQIVATPVHEDVTPNPKEEAQEAATAAVVTKRPVAVPNTGSGGGSNEDHVGTWEALAAVALLGIGSASAWRLRRRRS